MTLTFWWILVIVLGIIIGNLWLLRRSNKGLQKKPQSGIQQKKSAEGAVTGTVAASNVPQSDDNKASAKDQHHLSDSDSDGGSGSV